VPKKIDMLRFAHSPLHFPIRKFSLLALLLLSLFPVKLQAVVTIYPEPDGVPASGMYTVTVDQNARSCPSFVYTVQNQWPGQSSSEADSSWTSFDFTGSVEVHVQMTLSSGTTYTTPAVQVLPSRAKITATVRAINAQTYEAVFTVSQPGQYAVDFYDAAIDPTDSNVPVHPFLVFANPPERHVPNPRDSKVIYLRPGDNIPNRLGEGQTLYFSPGAYDLGSTSYILGSNQSVYLAGGSYLKGAFIGNNVQHSQIFGRGVLSGENFYRDSSKPAPFLSNSVANGTPPLIYLTGIDTRDILLDGITFIQAPFYNIELAGADNQVNNVKAIAWYGSTDGIAVAFDHLDQKGQRVAGRGLIKNSFFKVNDDSIKLASSDLVVTDCTIWKLSNAAAFELGANGANSLSHITVSHSDVIRSEYTYDNPTNAIFAANYGGSGKLHDYLFDDIAVEHSSWQLFQLAIGPNQWLGGSTTLGSIKDLRFSNIQVSESQTLLDVFRSYDPLHAISNVTFCNVVVDGKPYPTSPDITYNANRTLSFKVIPSPVYYGEARTIPSICRSGL
jgi:hypothetical protein